jgi:shikimate kinase
LLHTPDPQAKLILLFQQRDPLYRQIADLVVSTDNVSIPVVTERLLQQIAIAGKNSLNCQIAP